MNQATSACNERSEKLRRLSLAEHPFLTRFNLSGIKWCLNEPSLQANIMLLVQGFELKRLVESCLLSTPFIWTISVWVQFSFYWRSNFFWENTAVIWTSLFRILLSWLHQTWSCWWFRGFCLYFRCRNWLHSFDLFMTDTAFIDLTEFIKKSSEKENILTKDWEVMNQIIIII